MLVHYLTLGLPLNAPQDEIRSRYLELVRRFPPERHPAKFQRIGIAYEALRDDRSRIRCRISGLKDFHDHRQALEEIAESVDIRRKSPGLLRLLTLEEKVND